MKKILLAGYGKLAKDYAAELLATNESIKLDVVSKSSKPSDCSKISHIQCDLSVSEQVNQLNSDYDIAIIILAPSARTDEAYRQVYYQSTSNLLNRLDNICRIIFVSSTRVYSQSHGEIVDEKTPVRANDVQTKAIIDSENLILKNNRGYVIRFSGIYGKGRRSTFDSVTQQKSSRFSPDYVSNRIHQTDCVGILTFVTTNIISGKKLPSIILASDSLPEKISVISSWLSEKLQLPNISFNNQSQSLGKRCDNSLLISLGYQLKYPNYQAGFTSEIEKYSSDSN
ncbi:MAG: hypothetical protein V2I33_03095 [Kangiellaceae bacterium]|jgi:nucleoside-diphosphate-sugar epimerase|nr:hypothetical protein [Kangiellaceae bacterium]